MKLRRLLLPALLALGAAAFVSQAKAAPAIPLLQGGTLNQITYTNYENQYSSTGHYKGPGSGVAVGDYFVGIFQITTGINGANANEYQAGQATGQNYMGVFVEQVTNITPNGGQNFTLTLGPNGSIGSAVTSFIGSSKSSTVSLATPAALLSGNNAMFALYQSPGTTTFTTTGTSNAAFAGNWASAQQGSLYMSLGYDASSTSGYAFTQGEFPVPAPTTFNVTSYAGLNLETNATGFTFTDITDVNQTLIGPPNNAAQVMYEGKIAYNPFGVKGLMQSSDWDYKSSDPVFLLPQAVPEPASVVLFGMGAVGLVIGLRRRTKKASSI